LNRNKIRKGPKFRKEFEKFGNPFSIEKQLAHRGENQSGHTGRSQSNQGGGREHGK
jgi:hypothetical protein